MMDRYNSPRFQIAGTTSTQTLLGQVLGITAAGFLVTAAASYLTIGLALPPFASMISLLVGFGFLLAVSWTRANPATSMLMFYLFTACEGIGLGPVIGMYANTLGTGVVVNAALTTGMGMGVLASMVFLTSFDYRKLSGIAFGALVALVLLGIISMFTRVIHPELYAWLTLAVFTLLVLVDFARIRAGGQGATAIELATSIYLDAINIFLALLELAGARRSRD
ncbi:MAG TPA: Bax inhibitor-1 family protein [Candidatus Baltobacteraceae bacterium]|jgi:modulator of FtsH protease|nr:Bax inhibitor-1 family protein [Candidatus Baltobacteraceae bacterium]